MGKIALEEHFIVPELLPHMLEAMPNVADEARVDLVDRMTDFGERRLAAMDAAGVDVAVLSVSGPGVQAEPDPARAERHARTANDALASEIDRRPDRYRGFAHLAMHEPARAADELERCVTDLGFVGAMVNGHTGGIYLDDPRHDPFWERLEALRVPLYLHPTDAFVLPHVFEGAPELVKPTWEWTMETSAHFLRLVFSGVFDRFPGVTVVLGHMGETLPFVLWRLDSRADLIVGKRPLRHPPSTYLRQNLYVTTSGACDDVPLIAAVAALGAGRVMFSIDYPYEDPATAGRFLDGAAVPDDVRARIARGNAATLLGLGPRGGIDP